MGKTRKDEQRQTNLNSNPDNEVITEQQGLKTQCLCGFADTKNREALHLYIKLTSNGA